MYVKEYTIYIYIYIYMFVCVCIYICIYICCRGLSTFRSLRELLSGFVSTNTTQILQARKQMECDNNKYSEASNLIIITNMMKIIKIQCSFYVRVCVCRKHSYGQFNKNNLFAHVCRCICEESLSNQCVYSWPK